MRRRTVMVGTVLVIAADASVESLLGELVAFAGHRPLFDPTIGAAGESLRRIRPDIVILDTDLLAGVFDACLGAAGETRATVVLVSSTASSSELAATARVFDRPYFALPGGPRQLRALLDRVLEVRAPEGRTACRPLSAADGANAAGPHRALSAALVGVARATGLVARASAAQAATTVRRAAMQDLLTETRQQQGAMRAAVSDLARQLRGEDYSVEDAVAHVRHTVFQCASDYGEMIEVGALLAESERWTRDVYRVA